jgi:hypothetical protein
MREIEVDAPPKSEESSERHEQYPEILIGPLTLRVEHVINESSAGEQE